MPETLRSTSRSVEAAVERVDPLALAGDDDAAAAVGFIAAALAVERRGLFVAPRCVLRLRAAADQERRAGESDRRPAIGLYALMLREAVDHYVPLFVENRSY